MKYCRDYKSFQDDSLECPLVDEESESSETGGGELRQSNGNFGCDRKGKMMRR